VCWRWAWFKTDGANKAFEACSLELSAVYFQLVGSVFLSHKSVNSTFSRLFLVEANKLG
jgi:hypothetical protein